MPQNTPLIDQPEQNPNLSSPPEASEKDLPVPPENIFDEKELPSGEHEELPSAEERKKLTAADLPPEPIPGVREKSRKALRG